MLDTKVTVESGAQDFARQLKKEVKDALLYLGGAVRREARDSIRKGTKNNPSSTPPPPYGAAFSRTGIFKDSIISAFDENRQLVITGPKPFGGQSDYIGKTIPQGLEYGGRKRAPQGYYVPSTIVNVKWRKAEAKRRNKLSPAGRRWKAKTVKTVLIPQGVHEVKPRPTMRLAFNKIITATNLKRRFEQIGISNPQTIRKVIA